MYKLYWAQGSGAMAPQALFEEIGAEYEKIVIDFEKQEHKSDEFLSVNPMGQIPALVLPDGTLMTETAAMLVQIVDRHPEAKLAPPAPTRVFACSSWCAVPFLRQRGAFVLRGMFYIPP